MELEREPESVRVWLQEVRTVRTGSDKTQRIYKYLFPRFCEFAKMNPDELIADAVKSIEPGKKNVGEILAGQWFDHLVTQKGYSRNYAKTCYGVMRSFYRANNILFTGKTPNAMSKQRYSIPSKETLQKAWRLTDFETKIRVGILNDTGMRPEDAIGLVYGDVKQSFLENRDRIYIEKVSEKEDIAFAVCLSHPVTELVYQHIKERIAKGETITDETPLMTRSKVTKKIKEQVGGYKGKLITANQLWRDVVDFGTRVGAKMSPKTFRKRFRTFGSPIIGTDGICKMGGWALPGVGRSYYLPSEDETRRLYEKIEAMLSLEEPGNNRNTETKGKLEELEKQVAALTKTLEAMQNAR